MEWKCSCMVAHGSRSIDLLWQPFWSSSLKTAKLFESMAPKKQVQARWFWRFLGGWVLNPENGSDFGFKLWSSPVLHSLPYSERSFDDDLISFENANVGSPLSRCQPVILHRGL